MRWALTGGLQEGTATGRPVADCPIGSGVGRRVAGFGFTVFGQLVPGTAGLIHDRLGPGTERIPLFTRVLTRIFQRLSGLLAGFFHGFVPGFASAFHARIHHVARLHVGFVGQLHGFLPRLLGFRLRRTHHLFGALARFLGGFRSAFHGVVVDFLGGFRGFLGGLLDSLLGFFDLAAIVATIVAAIVFRLAGRQQKCSGQRRQYRHRQIAHVVLLLTDSVP